MTRTFHDLDGKVVKRDSGIWINGFDYTGMSHITPHVPEINDTIRAHCEEKAPLCGFPWYLPVHFLIRLVHCSSASVRVGLFSGPITVSTRYYLNWSQKSSAVHIAFSCHCNSSVFSGMKHSEEWVCFFSNLGSPLEISVVRKGSLLH